MRKMIENALFFTAILFLIVSITFLGGCFARMKKLDGRKTLDERIAEMNQKK